MSQYDELLEIEFSNAFKVKDRLSLKRLTKLITEGFYHYHEKTEEGDDAFPLAIVNDKIETFQKKIIGMHKISDQKTEELRAQLIAYYRETNDQSKFYNNIHIRHARYHIIILITGISLIIGLLTLFRLF